MEGWVKWIKWGRQRKAVASVIKKPMTAREICSAAQKINPRIHLRDIWRVVRSFMEHNLVYCLNPQHTAFRLYFWTDLGREVAMAAFKTRLVSLPLNLDWHQYALVRCSPNRKAVLFALAQPRFEEIREATAEKIRKHLCESWHPLGLNPVLKALKRLREAELVICSKSKGRRSLNCYQIHESGQAVIRALETESRFQQACQLPTDALSQSPERLDGQNFEPSVGNPF